MKITDITEQKNNKDRCNVFVEGVYRFAAFKECLITNDIYIGKEIETETIERILSEDEYRKAFDYAAMRLSYKPFSKNELYKILEGKGFDICTIEAVLAKLEEYKYIDDKELSRMIVSNSVNSKKLGKRAVYSKMMDKKIDVQTAKDAVENIAPEQELSNAIDVLQKYAIRYKFDGKDQKIKQKIYRALATKGYDGDTIREAFLKYGSDDEDNY